MWKGEQNWFTGLLLKTKVEKKQGEGDCEKGTL